MNSSPEMDVVNGHHQHETEPRGLVKSSSMLDKSVMKRQVNREHNSNFRAGHVDVQESCLRKVGLRGRKSYFLYAVLTFMLIMILINLGVTLLIMMILQIHYEGMHSMQFLPSSVLHFATPVIMSVIAPGNAPLANFNNKDITVLSTADSGLLSAKRQSMYSELASATVNVSDEVTMSVEQFDYTVLSTGQTLINTSNTVLSDLFTGYKNFTINRLQIPKLTSGVNEDLQLMSNSCVVRGNEGLGLTGDSVKLSASNSDVLIDVYTGSSLIMSSVGGVYLPTLPLAEDQPYSSYTVDTVYKMCACKSTGRLFRVPVLEGGSSCLNASSMCQ